MVIDHGKEMYPKNLMYRTYVAGKGEGRDRFNFQQVQVLTPDNGCPVAPDTSPGNISAVIGELFRPGGKSQITLFTPEGKASILEIWAEKA